MTEDQYARLDEIHSSVELVEGCTEKLLDCLIELLSSLKGKEYEDIKQFLKLAQGVAKLLDSCSDDNFYEGSLSRLEKLENKFKKTKKKLKKSKGKPLKKKRKLKG